ncbi:MAG: DUF362 domain-containing protein [Peptostreptococcaceae bacterium]
MIKYNKKASVLKEECVACGTCAKICPLNAIEISYGIYAKVNSEKCVGCGKCKKVCPASVIEILEVK